MDFNMFWRKKNAKTDVQGVKTSTLATYGLLTVKETLSYIKKDIAKIESNLCFAEIILQETLRKVYILEARKDDSRSGSLSSESSGSYSCEGRSCESSTDNESEADADKSKQRLVEDSASQNDHQEQQRDSISTSSSKAATLNNGYINQFSNDSSEEDQECNFKSPGDVLEKLYLNYRSVHEITDSSVESNLESESDASDSSHVETDENYASKRESPKECVIGSSEDFSQSKFNQIAEDLEVAPSGSPARSGSPSADQNAVVKRDYQSRCSRPRVTILEEFSEICAYVTGKQGIEDRTFSERLGIEGTKELQEKNAVKTCGDYEDSREKSLTVFPPNEGFSAKANRCLPQDLDDSSRSTSKDGHPHQRDENPGKFLETGSDSSYITISEASTSSQSNSEDADESASEGSLIGDENETSHGSTSDMSTASSCMHNSNISVYSNVTDSLNASIKDCSPLESPSGQELEQSWLCSSSDCSLDYEPSSTSSPERPQDSDTFAHSNSSNESEVKFLSTQFWINLDRATGDDKRTSVVELSDKKDALVRSPAERAVKDQTENDLLSGSIPADKINIVSADARLSVSDDETRLISNDVYVEQTSACSSDEDSETQRTVWHFSSVGCSRMEEKKNSMECDAASNHDADPLSEDPEKVVGCSIDMQVLKSSEDQKTQNERPGFSTGLSSLINANEKRITAGGVETDLSSSANLRRGHKDDKNISSVRMHFTDQKREDVLESVHDERASDPKENAISLFLVTTDARLLVSDDQTRFICSNAGDVKQTSVCTLDEVTETQQTVYHVSSFDCPSVEQKMNSMEYDVESSPDVKPLLEDPEKLGCSIEIQLLKSSEDQGTQNARPECSTDLSSFIIANGKRFVARGLETDSSSSANLRRGNEEDQNISDVNKSVTSKNQEDALESMHDDIASYPKENVISLLTVTSPIMKKELDVGHLVQ